MSDIKPIETRYAGCRFRSRLEARWAVFFDRLGIKWLYEPQGFEVGERRRRYLPDFHLPDLGTWVEVKGTRDDLDLELIAEAVMGPCSPIMMVLGPVADHQPGRVPVHTVLMPALDFRPTFGSTSEGFRHFIDAVSALGDEQQETIRRHIDAQSHPVTMMHAFFIHGSPSTFMPIGMPLSTCMGFDPVDPTPLWPILPMPEVKAAYQAARSARFEHGEEG